MPPERFPPDDPREWLNRARSSLSRAKVQTAEAYLEDLCFDAQQAAEKAIKAVLIKRGIAFPYIHDLAVCGTITSCVMSRCCMVRFSLFRLMKRLQLR